MNTTTLLLIVLLQAVVTVIVFFVLRGVTRCRKAMPDEQPCGDESENPVQQFLEHQITQTKAELQADAEGTRQKMLQLRLGYLETEKTALAESTQQADRFWPVMEEGLAALLPAAPEPVAAPAAEAATPPPADDSEKETLRELVTTYEKRVEGLEMFRDQFLGLKERFGILKASQEKLQAELDRVLPQSERTEELERLNEELQQQKKTLEQQLDELITSADEIPGSGEAKGNTTGAGRADAIAKNVSQLDDHMS